MIAVLGTRLHEVRRQLREAAANLAGARALAARIYGVGPIAALAMTAWLAGAGRFSSSRKAVRFTGLDITVYSSDGKRAPGRSGPASVVPRSFGRARATGPAVVFTVTSR